MLFRKAYIDAMPAMWNTRLLSQKGRTVSFIMGSPQGKQTESKNDLKKNTSDIHISSVVNSAVTDEELFFYKQLGLDHIIVYIRDTDDDSFENLSKIFNRVRDAGFTIDAGNDARQ